MTASAPGYESKSILHQYLLFHYGREEEILPYDFGPREALNFPQRTVRECLRPDELPAGARALDLGCAVGRSSFELARYCTEVQAIDYSEAFIQAARTLQQNGFLDYKFKQIANLEVPAVARLPEGIDPQRVQFAVGDAHCDPQEFQPFDVVHAANLLCRMAHPERLINRLPDLVKPGGQLILVTPHTWLEEFTPSTNWPGASDGQKDPCRALQDELSRNFELLVEKDMPFLIREHARKFQWSVSLATVWQRQDISSLFDKEMP